jgi:magnesium transporter
VQSQGEKSCDVGSGKVELLRASRRWQGLSSRESQLYAARSADVDIVVATALIPAPGAPADRPADGVMPARWQCHRRPGSAEDPTSPIAGMPVLHVQEADDVVVLERSMASRYAGIIDLLFYHGVSAMLFGDAEGRVEDVLHALYRSKEAGMQLRHITSAGMSDQPIDAAPDLLRRSEGLVWLDIPTWDDQAEVLLRDVFGFHPLALADCSRRNPVPKVHFFPDHVFLVLHAPEPGAPGHVHSIELDQFVGDRYLVTVHGPLSSAADPAAARVEVDALEDLLASGTLRPEHADQLSHALTSAVADRLCEFVTHLTAELWNLEYRFQAVVTGGPAGRLRDPERFLDELFRARHGFLVARTQAAMSREVFARMHKVQALGPDRGTALLDDLVDQFNHLSAMADGEKENLQGTIDFYQARTNTELTVAAERLAVIAAITLPVTAVSSILGMNVIVNDTTQPVELAIAVFSMAVMSALLLRWAKRQGWW